MSTNSGDHVDRLFTWFAIIFIDGINTLTGQHRVVDIQELLVSSTVIIRSGSDGWKLCRRIHGLDEFREGPFEGRGQQIQGFGDVYAGVSLRFVGGINFITKLTITLTSKAFIPNLSGIY